MIPVILSGGSGTRLWPLSRSQHPKQCMPLFNNNSMLQNTLLRLKGVPELQQAVVLCNEQHRFMVAEQLRQLPGELPQIILEPIARNTAPALAVAALHALASADDALLLVLAADHALEDTAALHQAIERAKLAAEQGKIVTFGIVPTSAHTGYGYIHCSQQTDDNLPADVSAVNKFCEKPDSRTAQQFVQSGQYFWNSGMLLAKASVILTELQQFAPAIVSAARQALSRASADLDFIRLDRVAFSASPADSIDYAVLEKSASIAMVALNAGWSDVGSWDALWQVSDKDEHGNACSGDVILQQCTDSYVNADARLVAVIGLDNVVVVETKDAVLVASKSQVQAVQNVVNQLQSNGRPEAAVHREVYRPWGKYDAINRGSRYQVKQITVKPGASISLQLHHHRAEHWVVVSGAAQVRNGEREFLLAENESTYIPVGTIHSLHNPGKIPLELIEVQTGSYLAEDDIVRFDQKYQP